MSAFQSALARGDFLETGRIRTYCLLLLFAYMATILGLFVTANGLVDYQGRPLGTDFANV